MTAVRAPGRNGKDHSGIPRPGVAAEYTDHQMPRGDRLLWEIAGAPSLVDANALPDAARPPMAVREVDAMLRTRVHATNLLSAGD